MHYCVAFFITEIGRLVKLISVWESNVKGKVLLLATGHWIF